MTNVRLAAVLCSALWLIPAQAVMQDKPVPETHTVVSGDTLWDISETYFESPYEWPRLWSYNPEITNPHWIYPDSLVRLRPGEGQPVVEPAPVEMEPTKPPEPTGIYLRDLGFLDADAVEQAGTIMAAREEHMMMSPSDVVYLRLKKDAKPKIGGRYTIYRLIKSSEREKGEKGQLVRLLGEVKLLDYDDDKRLGHAEIMEASEPIFRGFTVAPITRNFRTVPPRKADKDLRAHVVATLFPRKLLYVHHLIFLDVGSEDGVKEGNRFFAIRKGDEWHQATSRHRIDKEIEPLVDPPKEPKDAYPYETVAVGMIVGVRPKTSTLLLTNSTRSIEIGQLMEMRAGE